MTHSPNPTPSAAPALDSDPQETDEWRQALVSLQAAARSQRVRQILDVLAAESRHPAIGWTPAHGTLYLNTIGVAQQPALPGDLAIEERPASLMRWHPLAMVVRANWAYGELGGHIASCASAADLFEVGFNHFLRAAGEAKKQMLATWSFTNRTQPLGWARVPSSKGVRVRPISSGRTSR